MREVVQVITNFQSFNGGGRDLKVGEVWSMRVAMVEPVLRNLVGKSVGALVL